MSTVAIKIGNKEVEFTGHVDIQQCDIGMGGLPRYECVCTDFWTESMEPDVIAYVNKNRSKIRAAIETKYFKEVTHSEED
jgi:hypothetical protein